MNALTLRTESVALAGMQVQIVAMVEADWPSVAEIWREGIATGHATFTAEPPPSFGEFLPGRHPSGNLVARHLAEPTAPNVIGWTTLTAVSTRPVYRGVAEVGVYVAAAARGRGVGAALLLELIRRSEAAGVWTLQAAIFPENTASLTLHERHGFRVVGRRERIGQMPAIGPRAGEWRDTLLLERRSTVVGI